ncbi:hypothetical protein FOCC_FOCC017861 [Frankliniella occidentalis]|nr:hypothetical protein FOCC_FOCC017861 [Frankliniella occidentalis]
MLTAARPAKVALEKKVDTNMAKDIMAMTNDTRSSRMMVTSDRSASPPNLRRRLSTMQVMMELHRPSSIQPDHCTPRLTPITASNSLTRSCFSSTTLATVWEKVYTQDNTITSGRSSLEPNLQEKQCVGLPRGTKAHDPIALRIKGCTKQPCQVEKGSVAVMEVDFEVGWDVTQLDVVVTAYALGTVINFPLKQKNACMSLTNAECPLDQYEEITYRLQLDIDSKYPSVSKA